MPTHWKKLNNPEFLGAYAFDPGEEKVGTIDYVQQESVVGADGKKEDCIVCHFRERSLKPLILNTTNCKMITKLYKTPYIESWAGKKIIMVVREVRAFGEVVDAVRIKQALPKDTAAKPVICEGCGNAIAAFGQYQPEDIARINRERYGKALCTECGKKMKEQAAQPAEQTNNAIANALMAETEKE